MMTIHSSDKIIERPKSASSAPEGGQGGLYKTVDGGIPTIVRPICLINVVGKTVRIQGSEISCP